MGIAVDFYANFAKRENSTLRPTASPYTLNCVLKDNCGIINPVLEIRGSGSSFNPSQYNYCHISTFGRYYFVEEWEYNNATWLCRLKVDVLATYKTQIGNQSFYVLRSSYASNINVVDDFYPSLAWEPNYYYDTSTFTFAQNMSSGLYVIGVTNNDMNTYGAISYYTIEAQELRYLLKYMLPQASDLWTHGFSGMTDTLYKAFYNPFENIKSCKWFPIGSSTGTRQLIKFGNYESDAEGFPLVADASTWTTQTRNVYLPSGWLSLEAKYRVNPYAHIYLVVNPWGVIELNPMDFTDTRTIKLVIYPDFISGDCLLKIYKTVGSTDYFITQKNTRIAVDFELSNSSVNASGFLGGVGGTLASSVGLSVGIASGNPAAIAGGVAGMAGGVGNTLASSMPTMAGSSGQLTGGIRALDGAITLIYQSMYFAQEDNTEFGKPLCDTRQISTIPGFVMCQNGDSYLQGAYKSEIDEVNEYLTGGFFYE